MKQYIELKKFIFKFDHRGPVYGAQSTVQSLLLEGLANKAKLRVKKGL